MKVYESKHKSSNWHSDPKDVLGRRRRASNGINKFLEYMQYQFNYLAVMRKIKKASENRGPRFPKEIKGLEYKQSRLSRYTGLMDVFEASISGERQKLEIVLQRSVVNNLLAKSDSVLPHDVRKALRAAQLAPV